MIKTLIQSASDVGKVRRLFRNELDRLAVDHPWEVTDDNREAMNQLCEWLAAGDYRLGPVLAGPVGTGKSSMIEAASHAMRCLHGFGMRTIEAIELSAACLGREGRAALRLYADHTKYPLLVIEDLMLEKNAPSYIAGDDGINTVAELIQIRYKNWQRGFPLSTGFSHNATDEQLLIKYGERCVSRMAHMGFFLTVDGEDRRRGASIPKPAQMTIAFTAAPPPPEEVSTADPVIAARPIHDRIKALREKLAVPNDFESQVDAPEDHQDEIQRSA